MGVTLSDEDYLSGLVHHLCKLSNLSGKTVVSGQELEGLDELSVLCFGLEVLRVLEEPVLLLWIIASGS